MTFQQLLDEIQEDAEHLHQRIVGARLDVSIGVIGWNESDAHYVKVALWKALAASDDLRAALEKVKETADGLS